MLVHYGFGDNEVVFVNEYKAGLPVLAFIVARADLDTIRAHEIPSVVELERQVMPNV